MERRLMTRGMEVAVRPVATGRNRSTPPRNAIVVDPLPFPERPGVAEIEWADCGWTAAVSLRRIVKRGTLAGVGKPLTRDNE
jgi:hypothetical protein